MNVIKYISPRFWEWMEKHPKTVFKYGILIIIISFVTGFLIEIYLPKNQMDVISPTLYQENSAVRKRLAERENKLNSIVTELQIYQEKSTKELLSSEDTTRIKYLNAEYKRIKNEY